MIILTLRKGLSKVLGEGHRIRKELKSTDARLRETVGQRLALKQLLEDEPLRQVNRLTQRKAEEDPNFNSFLKQFQEKNKDLTVLDLSRYARDFGQFVKGDRLNQEELEIVEEFRKRRMEQRAADLLRQELKLEQKEKEKEYSQMVSAYRRRINRDEFDYPGREDRLSQGPFEIKDHFMLLILDKDSTTLITKLNRIKHFRYLVFMGNANGVISYGRGKGNDFELALRNALHNCKRNLIAIKQDRLHSFPQDIWARFQNYQMNFQSRGGFNPWGHPLLGLMTTLSGAIDLRFDVKHRSKSMYGLVNGFFKVMTQNTTPQEISERYGFKVYSQSWRKMPNYKTASPFERQP